MLGFTISCQSKSPSDRNNNSMTFHLLSKTRPNFVADVWMYMRMYIWYLHMHTVCINQQRSTHKGSGLQQTPPNFSIFHTDGTAFCVFTDPKILFSWWLSIWPTVHKVSMAMTYRQSCIYHAWNTRSKNPPVWRDVFCLNQKKICRKRRMTFAEGAFCHWCRGREQSD